MYEIKRGNIKRSTAIPLYLQIKDDIRSKIFSKEWKSGSKIPGESLLCEMYDVSRITVRKALEELQIEGYLTKLQGRGTFINRNTIEQRLSKFYSFSEELKQKGMKEYTEVISFTLINADEDLCANLNCREGERVFRIERVRNIESGPYAVEISHIPQYFAPKLTRELIAEKGLYSALNSLGVYPDSAVEQFSAINLLAETAKLLEVEENDAAISLCRTTYSAGTIVEYCTSMVRGDFFSYTVELR